MTSIPASNVPSADSLRHTGLKLIEARLPRDSRVTLIKSIAGGYTNAEVILCDVDSGEFIPGTEQIRGQYILKIEKSDGASQATAHRSFVDLLRPFAAAHVPLLVMSAHGAGVAADLYQIAGLSLDNLRSAELLSYDDREEVCADAGTDLLRCQLETAGVPDYTRTVGSVMREWLGDHHTGSGRGKRIRESAQLLGISGPVFQYLGEILPDPLVILETYPEVVDSALHCFVGQVHGDLHLRNIMARGSIQTRDLRYWVIDVSWGTAAPLMYDQAYLEMAALVFGLRTASGPTNLLGILGKLDDVPLAVPAQITSSDVGTINLISRMRSANVELLTEREAGRQSVWERQYLAARIAAGLNWAAKPLDSELRQAAFLSSAWAMRLLLRGFDTYATTWAKLVRQEAATSEAAPVGVLTTEEALKQWQPFHGSGVGRDLILIADSGISDDNLATLATCGWAAVIDLDEHSDESGLAASVVPVLKMRRHVSIFGENPQITNPGSATNWLMANGWSRLQERAATSADAWRREGYRARVRAVVDEIVDATPNTSVAVMCLRSGRQDGIVDYVLDYIDERYGGLAVQLDLSSSGSSGPNLKAFLDVVALSSVGTGVKPALSIPGNDGPSDLSREDLNRLAVDLEVLHSAVLEDSLTAAPRPDDFWRGRPPTWDELEAGIDVRREAVHPRLVEDLQKRLQNHQLAVVHLEHSPGAGGTTLARRVAWDLHRTHPTALLRTMTPMTVERIDEIFQATGKAVLLVAEAADLPESGRDELINSLRQRNSRAVVLWVNRTNSGSRAEYTLMDPVTPQERQTFIREYTRRAGTDHARRMLQALADAGPNSVPANRLSPFYFGLCAYEAEFEGLEPFVHNHLEKLGSLQRKVAQYLALITRFAQVGIPVDLVRRWLRKPIPSEGEYGDQQLRAVLGPNLRHLVVYEAGELRLLHPLIADRLMAQGHGGTSVNLAQLAVEFIDAVTDSLGAANSTTRLLLAEVFVRRKSWSEEEQGRRENFAEIIQLMPTLEGGEAVFKELTEKCPDEPHFWNHRGRYHIYHVKGEYRQAEEFVKKAVEASNSRDSLHLHTLGMVRRFWIEHELNAISQSDSPDPGAALEAIKPLFDSAMEAFAKARESSNGEHSWVTPIQLITTVIERLVSLSGANNLIDYLNAGGDTADWVADSLHKAENLLDELRGRYAESRTTGNYYTSLCRNLDILYGDLEELIAQWRELQNLSEDRAAIGLTLARAIYAKSDRSIAQMSVDDLREIVGMTTESVRAGSASEVDLRLWFQALRRLPEYSELAALEQFSWYAAELGSLEATYYLYILHFLRWQRGESLTPRRALTYLEECQRLSRRTRNQRSFEWLGASDEKSPLVHYTELGRRLLEYDNFWEKPYLLRRVTGVIDEIKGPQAGTISIRIDDGRFPIFFSPRDKFLKTRDINILVEFYVGFSYEGLRAWGIERPGVKPASLVLAEKQLSERGRPESHRGAPALPRALRRVTPPPATVEGPPGEEPATPEPVAVVPGSLDPALLEKLRQSVAGDEARTIQNIVVELLVQARADGQPLTSRRLGEALQYRLGMQRYQDFRSGPGKLRGAVQALGFHTVATSSGFEVDLI